MTGEVEIAITGSGSLATEVVHALAVAVREQLTVALLGRCPARLATLARSAAARATAVGGRLKIVQMVIDWSDDTQLCRTILALHAKVLLHTASLQSPWTLGGSDRWASLISCGGYGITLPLQTVLALRIGRAINNVSPDTCFLNACYPDAVNRLLYANGVKVTCGIGNVAILAALLLSELPIEKSTRLRLIAHHAHISASIKGQDLQEAPLKAWIDQDPIHLEAARWLREARLPSNLNSIVGATAVPMLLALIGRLPPWEGHSSGPMGLLGGYPVILAPNRIELDLPKEVDLAEASALNMAAAISDGATVKENGDVVLSDFSARALEEIAGGDTMYALSWHATDIEKQAAHLLALRKSLTSQ